MKKTYSSEYFSPKDTLTCGQVFRYKLKNDGVFEVISKDKRCFLSSESNKTILECDAADLDYFENYFDLNRDYEAIVRRLSGFPELSDCVEYGKGIRILRQDFEETVFSFIISANNNIKRIQNIIERLSTACGKNMGDYYAFPTASELQFLSVRQLRDFGLGYRAEYIYDTSRVFPAVKQSFRTLFDDDDVMKNLLKLKGVGPKVANCIMLFGLSLTSSYPVDTWIFKSNRTDELDTPQKVSRFYRIRYGEYAGFAQQYIFHYARNGKNSLALLQERTENGGV